MKLFMLCCVLQCALANSTGKVDSIVPQPGDTEVVFRGFVEPQYYYINNGNGNYKLRFRDKGIDLEVRGELRNKGREDQFVAVSGKFTWYNISGNAVEFKIDEYGSRPTFSYSRWLSAVPALVLGSILGG